MSYFTVFCREASGKGTTYIAGAEADTATAAARRVHEECLAEWEKDDPTEVWVVGIAAGDIALSWDDEAGLDLAEVSEPGEHRERAEEPAANAQEVALVARLRAHGQLVTSDIDAIGRMDRGEAIYAHHEQDPVPKLVTSVDELRAYTPDQLLALPADIALASSRVVLAGGFSAAEHQQMDREGWGIFEVESHEQIQRDDEAQKFPDDCGALWHVYEQARAGSVLHRKALLQTLGPPAETVSSVDGSTALSQAVALLQRFDNAFGTAVENDDEIGGADAVDVICALSPDVRAFLASIEAAR